MRHVRMLGLCLVAVCVAGAVAATGAFAAVKEPDLRWRMFRNCPLHGAIEGQEVRKCQFAATRNGEGGFYSVGPITVPVTKQIVLQGASTKPEGPESERPHLSYIVPPENGAPPIVPTPETVPGEPLANVSEAEMEEFEWPQALRESYRKAQKRGWLGAGKIKEIIEPAGADVDEVSEFNILLEEGPALIAKVQIQGKNIWLKSLGGSCVIGSEADPIIQKFTTGESISPLTGEVMKGTSGLVTLAHEAEIANLAGTVLVDNTYPVPAAEKCGGAANEAYLDPVVNKAFGLPAVAGASKTELVGQLAASSVIAAREHFEE